MQITGLTGVVGVTDGTHIKKNHLEQSLIPKHLGGPKWKQSKDFILNHVTRCVMKEKVIGSAQWGSAQWGSPHSGFPKNLWSCKALN